MAAHRLFTATLVLGEIRKGVERLQPRDEIRAADFETWLGSLPSIFDGRLLVVDAEVADRWGRMNAGRTLAAVDSLLAATAAVHGLTLVTRNEADVAGLGVSVLNPFRAPSA